MPREEKPRDRQMDEQFPPKKGSRPLMQAHSSPHDTGESWREAFPTKMHKALGSVWERG